MAAAGRRRANERGGERGISQQEEKGARERQSKGDGAGRGFWAYLFPDSSGPNPTGDVQAKATLVHGGYEGLSPEGADQERVQVASRGRRGVGTGGGGGGEEGLWQRLFGRGSGPDGGVGAKARLEEQRLRVRAEKERKIREEQREEEDEEEKRAAYERRKEAAAAPPPPRQARRPPLRGGGGAS